MVNAHQGDPPLTLDGAAQQLKDTWARENLRKVDAWNVQLQQDQVALDRLDTVARQAQAAQLAQHGGLAVASVAIGTWLEIPGQGHPVGRGHRV